MDFIQVSQSARHRDFVSEEFPGARTSLHLRFAHQLLHRFRLTGSIETLFMLCDSILVEKKASMHVLWLEYCEHSSECENQKGVL
ncbi:MAG: hypothetical protein KDK23_06700 [Leptospiraceae bacterium]|nr:hypothetical protein [Leptospiraceae bacterium]